MCTVTILPLPGGGLRLVHNRDEQRGRAAGLPPRMTRVGERSVLAPVDPAGGGTWVGVNDAGLVACVLNANPPEGPGQAADGAAGPRRSRGGLVLAALRCADGAAAAQAVVDAVASDEAGGDTRGRFDGVEGARAAYPPFTLVVAEPAWARVWVVRRAAWQGSVEMAAESIAAGPRLWTSSGLGDALVEGPRRGLFARMLEGSPSAEAQDAFHAHAWADRGALSVRMARADARTVSRTVVMVRPGAGTVLRYAALSDADGAEETPQEHRFDEAALGAPR